ncbi:MAG: hypothetical protein CBB71_16585 [Rhodopirellula sp. TMED11]|nr:MAG: hypothetical protein CBB71_16585 [Rhodopirellula sp. TMED11]
MVRHEIKAVEWVAKTAGVLRILLAKALSGCCSESVQRVRRWTSPLSLGFSLISSRSGFTFHTARLALSDRAVDGTGLRSRRHPPVRQATISSVAGRFWA